MASAPEPGDKVVVTGGAGYIGSVLTDQLLAAGYRVTVIDNLMYGGASLHGFLSHPNFTFVRGDITNPGDVAAALSGATAVVHLAALVGDPACARNPELARSVNRDGADIVRTEADAAGVKRFLFASTCSNYGRMTSGDGWVDETSALSPVSLYAELKVEFEQRLLTEASGMTTTCLRFATAFGMSYRPRFDLTINQFTAELVEGRSLDVFGEQFWRPYCHTSDLARACCMVLTAAPEKVHQQAFNVGANEQNHTKKQLVDLIVQHTGCSPELVSYVHKDEDPRDYRVRCDKIRTALGFQPERPVVDGIDEIAAAIRSGVIETTADSRYHN